VFGTNTDIYTGDSTAAGASVNDLNIHALSSSNVGDTNGVMAYSNGQGNVFINLSKANDNANIDDSLSSAADGLTITSLSKGAYGTVQNSTTAIPVGASDTTVGGMIAAINADTALGLHASFVTEAQAGMTTNPTYTGIEITSTSGAIGQGTAPGVLGTIVANAAGDEFNDNTDGITITTADGVAHKVAVDGATSAQATANQSKLTDIAATINGMNLGVTASVDGTNTTMTLTSGSADVKVTSSLYDNTTTASSVDFTAGSYYSVGISAGATAITDSSTSEADTGSAQETANASASGGIATISYSDNSGQALNGTDLTSQTNAELTLTSLNAAIVDVAAQDGYIGAQINQLNAATQVLSTQSENVTSAQNAVQATDYASATSNMSKYEILSQTGISALAQANSMQQEVTKLLQ
jgi:flagellin